jgi:hypothetical protein
MGHNLRRNCLVKHVTERKIEGRIEVSERRRRRRSSYLTTLKNEKILATERGSTR